MRILFIGTVEFSKRLLLKLLETNAEIAGVIYMNESKFNADFTDLSEVCKKYGIDGLATKDINSIETEEWIKARRPDIGFCFGWSQIIKKNILEIPPMGIVGYHPAKLPYNRGRHPIIWAICLGLKETASTFFFMDEGADTGDILSQEIVSIEYEDTALTLYNKLASTALRQMENFLPALQIQKYDRLPQDKAKGNSWRKRLKTDGQIDWRMTSEAIYNLVRALTRPYVGAHFIHQDKEIKVWRAKVVNDQYKDMSNLEPGKILDINVSKNTFDVKTYDGAIRILDHDLGSVESLGDYLI